MPPIISVTNLSKTYGSGFKALNGINLDIQPGEIFALLGPMRGEDDADQRLAASPI